MAISFNVATDIDCTLRYYTTNIQQHLAQQYNTTSFNKLMGAVLSLTESETEIEREYNFILEFHYYSCYANVDNKFIICSKKISSTYSKPMYLRVKPYSVNNRADINSIVSVRLPQNAVEKVPRVQK